LIENHTKLLNKKTIRSKGKNENESDISLVRSASENSCTDITLNANCTWCIGFQVWCHSRCGNQSSEGTVHTQLNGIYERYKQVINEGVSPLHQMVLRKTKLLINT